MPRLAVFTICQNEPVYAPVWLKHYTKHVDPCDIFILHHVDPNSEWAPDEAMDELHSGGAGASVWSPRIVPVHNEFSFDHQWMLLIVGAFQRFLLNSYDWVMFVEIDEIVVPTTGDRLADWLAVQTGYWGNEVLRCQGYEVVQTTAELPIDWSRSLLRQRNWWYPSRLYSKPCISKVPMDWVTGFHDAPQALHTSPCPELLLLHLHKVDFETAYERAVEITQKRKLNSIDVALGHGYQNYLTDRARLAKWFRMDIDRSDNHVDTTWREANLVQIPESVKDLI